jgi:hypothetical protein
MIEQKIHWHDEDKPMPIRWNLCLILLTGIVTLITVVPVLSVAATQDQLIAEYLDAFRPHAMVPVLIPLGQQAGDVMDRLGEEFVSRRAECFTDLAVQQVPSSLPNLDLGAAAAARLGLALPQMGEADLRAFGGRRVVLRFERVTVETVSQGALRQSIKRQACPELARLIDKEPASLRDNVFLIGEVFRARRILRLDRSARGSGNITLDGFKALAARFGLRLRAEGGGDLESAQTVELGTEEPLPAAFRPAFIRIEPGQPGSFRAPGEAVDRVTIRDFSPNRESDRDALNAWINRQVSQLPVIPP